MPKKDNSQLNNVKWVLGNIPLFDIEQLLIGKPPVLTENQITSNFTPKYLPFEASECARISHVLADPTQNFTLNSLRKIRSISELDKERLCELSEWIAPLFINSYFKTDRVKALADGVTLYDINGIDPAVVRFKINSKMLKDHFGILKYRINTSISN